MSGLRTPLSYHGGKQKLAAKICSLIPEHQLYVEGFTGGAAVFFAKLPSEMEVLNDTNGEVINFYRVCKNRFHELAALVRVTLHSRRLHDDAWIVYNAPHLFDEVKRAWAVWVLSSQSFSAILDNSWGYDKGKNTTTKKISNRREEFTEELAIRLQNVQIECADALYIIQSRDTAQTFFYLDPPYVGSALGHYDGYTQEDFDRLLDKLARIEGKFLLSSYPNPALMEAAKRHGWAQWSVEQGVSINAKSGYLKRKVEVLTANYPIE